MKSADLQSNTSDFDNFQKIVDFDIACHYPQLTIEIAKERFAHCVANLEVDDPDDPESLKHQLHFCLWWLTVLAELKGLKLDEIAGER